MSCETIDHPSRSVLGLLRDRIEIFWAKRAQKKDQRISRAAFKNLLDLDEKMLKDIGVARNDVLWASKLPLSQNAGQELHNISLQNRTKF